MLGKPEEEREGELAGRAHFACGDWEVLRGREALVQLARGVQPGQKVWGLRLSCNTLGGAERGAGILRLVLV